MAKQCSLIYRYTCIFAFKYVLFITVCSTERLYEVDLPPEHMPFYLFSHFNAAEECRRDKNCPYKGDLDKDKCWGYEDHCQEDSVRQYKYPSCPEDSRGWVQSKPEQIKQFFKEGDFGYIREKRKELRILCKPKLPEDSLLACVKLTRYCLAKNIMFDFESLLSLPEPMRYREDVIGKGQVGGHCILDKDGLKREGTQKSPLQSWFAELENFTEYPEEPIKTKKCDIVISKPALLMKLDATVSMYHHFCDFVNLYLTLHMNNSFSRDVQIVVWDTISVSSNFEIMWGVFTDHPVLTLENFKGKKVCFENVILGFLPRMIYGMYYNMPLIPGCGGSGLFHAFTDFVLHRLNIVQKPVLGGKLRITLLSRGTKFRRILNEDDIVRTLAAYPDFIVQKVDYNRRISFIDQMTMTHNTDIFIGMHGSGLTHLLFLPDWATIFELYNCGDENCYKDLARLRGVNYMTWENEDKIISEDEGHHPTLGAHAKFTNYEFDVDELVRLVLKAANQVREHPDWLKQYHGYHNNFHAEF